MAPTSEEFTRRVHDLSVGLVENQTAVLDNFNRARNSLREANAFMDAIVPHKIGAAQAGGTILYLCQEQLGTALPVSEDARKYNAPKIGAILIAVGLLCGAVGAGYATLPEAKKMTTNHLDVGLLAMKEGQYAVAISNFQQVIGQAGVDQEAIYARIAECSYRSCNYDQVLTTCKVMEEWRPDSPNAPFWRGAVYRRQGRNEEAKAEFEKANFRGCRGASNELKITK